MKRPSISSYRAFTLVEVTLALGVAAIGLVAVFGLLPVGINTNQMAFEQTAAADVLSAVTADLRSTPATSPTATASTSQQFSIVIPNNAGTASKVSMAYVTSDGKVVADLTSNPLFVLTATAQPGATVHAPTLVALKINWPAAAAGGKGSGSVEQLLVLDRN